MHITVESHHGREPGAGLRIPGLGPYVRVVDRLRIWQLWWVHRADRLHVLNRVDRLVVDIYRLSARFPDAERYGLSSQVRRAAVSIGSNIVEGAGYGTNAGFIRQLRIARGSLAEVAYQVRIAHLVGYISAEEHKGIDTATQHIRRMLTGLISSLKAQ